MSYAAGRPLPGRAPGQRVSAITLQVEALPGGGMRLSTPLARGWAATARNSHELAKVVEQAFLEVACASYARFRNERYDLDSMTISVAGDVLAGSPQGRQHHVRTVRHQAYDAAAWTKMEDGRWRSPSGRAYRADSTAVRNVVRKRQERGLPD